MRDKSWFGRVRRGLPVAVVVLGLLPACTPAQSRVHTFHGDRAYADLKQIVAFGPREPGSPASTNTKEYIRQQLAAVGLTLQEMPFTAKTPLGPVNMVNLFVEVKGTQPGIILITNHYDTKFFRDFTFLGANDGGSTTAWMIELARALGPTRQGRTLWLCWFDGEEAYQEWTETDSLYGSRYMVAWLRDSGKIKDIAASINVDMIGDCQLDILRDKAAPAWMVDAVWSAADKLGLRGFSMREELIEDDHKPFREAGLPAMNLIDFHYGGGSIEHQQNWHTSRDQVDLVCPESLETVGEAILAALPAIEAGLSKPK